MLPAALVTNDISPNIRLLPAFMIIATPRPSITITGSNQEPVVSASTSITNSTANSDMRFTSSTVLTVATAVDTAEPLRAASSPTRSRIA